MHVYTHVWPELSMAGETIREMEVRVRGAERVARANERKCADALKRLDDCLAEKTKVQQRLLQADGGSASDKKELNAALHEARHWQEWHEKDRALLEELRTDGATLRTQLKKERAAHRSTAAQVRELEFDVQERERKARLAESDLEAERKHVHNARTWLARVREEFEANDKKVSSLQARVHRPITHVHTHVYTQAELWNLQRDVTRISEERSAAEEVAARNAAALDDANEQLKQAPRLHNIPYTVCTHTNKPHRQSERALPHRYSSIGHNYIGTAEAEQDPLARGQT